MFRKLLQAIDHDENDSPNVRLYRPCPWEAVLTLQGSTRGAWCHGGASVSDARAAGLARVERRPDACGADGTCRREGYSSEARAEDECILTAEQMATIEANTDNARKKKAAKRAAEACDYEAGFAWGEEAFSRDGQIVKSRRVTIPGFGRGSH